ncbi:MAG: isoprenylcysteine carboxylmethyltransferase family protein [Candidatus Gracilibacteria bacterium]|nr:isoprenylcysteine carboxylmethyltransferase family protein [Candidatus Gracilibacteria bacterium]
MKELIKNYISSAFFIILGYVFYTQNSYYKGFLFFDIQFINTKINTLDIFQFLLYLYLALLIPFYLVENNKSKARIVLNSIKNKLTIKNYKIKDEEKNSILAWIVKFFFAPLMIIWIFQNLGVIVNKVYYGFNETSTFFQNFYYFYNNYIFLTIFKLIIFIDLLFFTLGYLLESKYLGNKIKSVEPTVLGWLVALICYPPFNSVMDNFFAWYSSETPMFNNFYVHIILNSLLLVFFAIYSRASVALGLKASNLTNRGIISKGPYKYVRHPAYISKNISWFIGALPIIFINIKEFNIYNLFLIFASISAWGFIYYMRAVTEERHLELDDEYIEYKKKVKYKFIPKIF